MNFENLKLFSQALSMPYLQYTAGWGAFYQGREDYAYKRVQIVEMSDEAATCQVADVTTSSSHEVVLRLEERRLTASCTCRQDTDRNLCRHIVAAGLAVQVAVNEKIQNAWQSQVSLLLPVTAGRRQIASDYILLFSLVNLRGGYTEGWQINPVILLTRKIPRGSRSQKLPWTSEAVRHLLEQNPKLRNHATSKINHELLPEHCVNATAEVVSFARLLLEYNALHAYRYGSGSSPVGRALEMASLLDLPLYLSSKDYRYGLLSQPLRILPQPVRLYLEIERRADGAMYLHPHLYSPDYHWEFRKQQPPTVVSEEPLWLIQGNRLMPVERGVSLAQIEGLPKMAGITIPADETDQFINDYLPTLAESFTFSGKGVSQQDIHAEPQARLYLSEIRGELSVLLRFGYGEYEVSYDSKATESFTQFDSETLTFARIYRQLDLEEAAYKTLSRFGLKRTVGPGEFCLRARVDIADFLLQYIPKLTQEGFEVFGEEKIKSVRVNRNRPTISFNVSSGIDWFDVLAVVNYGDIEVSLKQVRKALQKKARYIKLTDGTIGEIPEEWLDRYKHLFNLAEETVDGGLRLANYQITLLDQLLSENENLRADEEFHHRRQRLRDFTGIQSQPIPRGFVGNLRPYQKAGLDWLHFLHEYEFGGCLADDMGLGKTIQVLAFLQSMRENEHPQRASLIVLPRSLLVNWQREAERFAPELRLLEYHGNQRAKDVSEFDQYDLIVTTYGIILRDIQFLRDYRFHYVVLDESQAIKNPLSQSAKAARLLVADHRLVMTGTPIENSTFELWSQFAFLNPGLLGNLEYFRSEFGTPIEKRGDQDAAQFLRRMVYPFILRRTKGQVAPELPPRTERILITDMQPAQRKLYNRTRDYYRGLLLGMIEKQGMNDARMKILEGLLRLRQICNHPRLVEANFRGESAKFELLLETLETLQSESHKALVFSQFVETLKLLRVELNGRGVQYAYLDGQTQNRQERVDVFQSDASLPFFLISLKAGGLGLNLTAADYVIHIDPWWNPAVEMQASDRTHRIGQDKPVFIYKLIVRDSVEEKILQLQERKKNLVEQLITTESSFFKSITEEDVRALFS